MAHFGKFSLNRFYANSHLLCNHLGILGCLFYGQIHGPWVLLCTCLLAPCLKILCAITNNDLKK